MAELIRPGTRDQDRHDRTRLIPWVDFERINSAKVLVVGAGALGNEAVKDLALFGFRHMDVMDMDSVVRSNLSRCVLFRKVIKPPGGARRLWWRKGSGSGPGGTGKADRGQGAISEPKRDETLRYHPGLPGQCGGQTASQRNSYHARVPYVDGGTDGFEEGCRRWCLPRRPACSAA